MITRSVSRLTSWSHHLIARTIVLVLFGLAGLSGIGFIAIGGYLSLSEALAPWAAGLIVGCVFILLSLFGTWIALVYWRKTAQVQTPEQSAEEKTQPHTTVDTAAHLGEILGANFGKSGIRTTDVMIAALVAGTILGASPALRERLLRRKRDVPPSGSSRR